MVNECECGPDDVGMEELSFYEFCQDRNYLSEEPSIAELKNAIDIYEDDYRHYCKDNDFSPEELTFK